VSLGDTSDPTRRCDSGPPRFNQKTINERAGPGRAVRTSNSADRISPGCGRAIVAARTGAVLILAVSALFEVIPKKTKKLQLQPQHVGISAFVGSQRKFSGPIGEGRGGEPPPDLSISASPSPLRLAQSRGSPVVAACRWRASRAGNGWPVAQQVDSDR
jgi:hypothetical protein